MGFYPRSHEAALAGQRSRRQGRCFLGLSWLATPTRLIDSSVGTACCSKQNVQRILIVTLLVFIGSRFFVRCCCVDVILTISISCVVHTHHRRKGGGGGERGDSASLLHSGKGCVCSWGYFTFPVGFNLVVHQRGAGAPSPPPPAASAACRKAGLEQSLCGVFLSYVWKTIPRVDN